MDNIYHIFTHKDLDGAGSLLTFNWSHPNSHVTYREVTNNEIDIVKDYVLRTCNPPNIKVFDMSLREEFLPELDYEYIHFIDHHERSLEHVKKFKNAKIDCEPMSSNTLHIRKLYKGSAPTFTDEQKKLILLIDDHDSGEYRFSESYDLNILFWTQFKNAFCYFCDFYKNGFRPFTPNQLEIIKRSKENAKMKAEQADCYGGNMVLRGELKYVVAAMTESFNNLVIDTLIAKYKPDIFFYINTRTEKVSMRQTKTDNPINLGAFAEEYCDGSGHMNAAGGKVTPLFLELTKKLKPI